MSLSLAHHDEHAPVAQPRLKLVPVPAQYAVELASPHAFEANGICEPVNNGIVGRMDEGWLITDAEALVVTIVVSVLVLRKGSNSDLVMPATSVADESAFVLVVTVTVTVRV